MIKWKLHQGLKKAKKNNKKPKHLLSDHFNQKTSLAVYSLCGCRCCCQSRSLWSVWFQQIGDLGWRHRNDNQLPNKVSAGSVHILCVSVSRVVPAALAFAGVCHTNPFGSLLRSCEVLHLQHQRHEWIWAQAAFASPPLSLPQLSPPTRSTSLSSIGLRVEPGAGVEGGCYTYLCCVCASVCVSAIKRCDHKQQPQKDPYWFPCDTRLDW